jgi:hypothetical protein
VCPAASVRGQVNCASPGPSGFGGLATKSKESIEVFWTRSSVFLSGGDVLDSDLVDCPCCVFRKKVGIRVG